MQNCRVCSSKFTKINDFGKMPIANGFLKSENFSNEYFYRMETAYCSNCHMFQLIEQPKPEMMFHENYAFFSSTSKKMATHFAGMAKHYGDNFLKGKTSPFVVELGSNDGIMLKNFAGTGTRVLGVEPSANVAAIARENGVDTICAFFGEETAKAIKNEKGQADIITAANVMCHIPDIQSVGRGVSALLKDDGIFVFEDPYLGDMIQKTAYDQIYDEHVYIFSVQSVGNAFRSNGLEVFHVEPQTTHGGSMRYYLCRKGAHKVRESVATQLAFEEKLGLNNLETFLKFREQCERSKEMLVTKLKELKKTGKRVVGYAATSKSTTVLNYCGIGPDLIEFISDTTPIKQGKFSPGMHIPVKPHKDFKDKYPEIALLFAWNHSQEVFENEKDFVKTGGQWLVFVPEVKVLAQ